MLKLFSKLVGRPVAAKPKPEGPGALKPGATQLASSAERVRELLLEIRASRVLVHADRAGFETVQGMVPGAACHWVSNQFDDIEAGATHAENFDWRGVDAAVVAGSDLARRYRHAMRLMAAVDTTRPVFWIGNGFEFCGGTLSAPSGMNEVEGLLFNHFDAFFGVKDPLLFRIEVYHGPEVKRYYRILRANESHLIRLSEHFPETRHAVSLAAFVEHPVLTRDRHYRLRLVGDVFWKDSLTTLHSAHEFNRSPSHEVEFRLPAWLVRDGEVVLTLPNFDRRAPAGAALETVIGAQSQSTPRRTQDYIEQSVAPRDGLAANSFFGWRYQGFGGSNWFVLENASALAAGHKGSIAGNHHLSCPVLEMERHPAADQEELARYERLERNGFVLSAYPLPIPEPGSNLAFGFEADAANPPQRNFRIDFFDGDGAHLGRIDHEKQEPGPLFSDALADLLGPDGARARLALISIDWLKSKLRYKGLKPMANLILRQRQTGDQDVTEFQSCWRNLGTAVPGFPHWLTDELAVVGRTNVIGRVRCNSGLRTGVMMINASGRLAYSMNAEATISVFNQQGEAISGKVTIPAFTWRLLWIDELLPDLARHLGDSARGPLILRSGDADLNCQIVTTSPAGAVSIQHLWGY